MHLVQSAALRSNSDKELFIRPQDEETDRICNLAKRLRDQPLLPCHPDDIGKTEGVRDFDDLTQLDAGIDLPLVHCAFKKCTWTSHAEHEDEVERLTSKHRKEIEKLQEELASSGPAGDGQIEEKKWLKEREQMTRQMSLLTSHLDSSKKMQESLLQALTRQQEQAQTRKDRNLASFDGETDSQTFSENQEANEKL